MDPGLPDAEADYLSERLHIWHNLSEQRFNSGLRCESPVLYPADPCLYGQLQHLIIIMLMKPQLSSSPLPGHNWKCYHLLYYILSFWTSAWYPKRNSWKSLWKTAGRITCHPPTHPSNIAHCSLCEYVSLLVLFRMPLFFCLCVSMYMSVFTFSPTWFLLSLSHSPVCNLLISSAAAHQRIKAGWAPTR